MVNLNAGRSTNSYRKKNDSSFVKNYLNVLSQHQPHMSGLQNFWESKELDIPVSSNNVYP